MYLSTPPPWFLYFSKMVKSLYGKVSTGGHTKLLTHIPNKKELHLTAHTPTPVGANELPVYPSKSSMYYQQKGVEKS
jgi:hypothetical protein